MLLFAGIGITLGISRFSNERLILALKKESKKGQGDKLLATYAKINPTFCTLDATSAPLAWYAGAVYEQKGNYPEALSLYRKGLQAAPYHFRTINSLGIAYFRLGQADSALFYFNKAQQMATQWDEPIYNLAAVLHQQNKNLEAFRLLAKLPAVITDPRAETFKSVLFKARLDEARPGETPSNQARIDTLLADPLYPYKAHAKYQASGKSDTFWR
jgi:tetratricopeptide (TPR) repeat protein